MKEWKIVLVVLAAIGLCVGFFLPNRMSDQPIVINEVCTKNGLVGIDENYIGTDYVELYNTTKEVICLSDWYLSDEKNNLKKCRLQDLYIDPGENLLLYATGNAENEYSLNFKLSATGETLYLSDSQGELVDEIYVPKLDRDAVYARKHDGIKAWHICEATPGASNKGARELPQKVLENPVFSHKSGYYEEEFVLKISAGRGQEIYYTTDGSMPTRDSDRYPKEGILIQNNTQKDNVINSVQQLVPDWKDAEVIEEKADKITVIRAIAMDGKDKISEAITASYIVADEKYRDCKVMSLIAEPEELYGEDGIFVTGKEYDAWYLSSEISRNGVFDGGWAENYELTNFWKDGRSKEVLGNVQLFENGTEILNQQTGIRVQGNYTRLARLKNLQLISRKSYSNSRTFDRAVIKDYEKHSFYVSAVPEKAHCLAFASERNLGVQEYEVCPLFINGEYWYTAVLLEKYDEEYFQEHYGIAAENVLYLKDREAILGSDSAYLFDEMNEMLKNDDVSSVEKIVMLYNSIDVSSFVDWLCFNLFLCNNDISTRKNCVMWRSIEPGEGVNEDGKWRWLLYDIDHCAVSGMTESTDFSDFSIISTNRIYTALKDYDEFREEMLITAMDMMNTTFSKENVESVLGKWGYDISYSDHFFERRPEYMVQSLRNEFSLTGTLEGVTISVNDTEGGKILLNTIEPELTNGTWTGKYFTDYVVRATAVANPGYRFVGWKGTSDSLGDYIKVPVTEGGIYLQAIFEKE